MAAKRKLIKREESLLPESKKSHSSVGPDETNADINEFDKSPESILPPSWKEQYDNIVKMREDKSAPVDLMGVQSNLRDDISPAENRFHVLISVVLSSRTKDERSSAAMDRLREYGLTVEHIRETSVDELAQLIHPVSFYPTKAKYIKKIVEILHDEYDNDIPREFDDIISLPGVGPKMAFMLTNIVWNTTLGISVDSHIHRIANRMKWVNKTKNEEQTRKDLQDWLPKEYWKEVSGLLAGFGQQICKPISPLCHTCLNQSMCPSSSVKTKGSVKMLK